jgi:hypothetical protein
LGQGAVGIGVTGGGDERGAVAHPLMLRLAVMFSAANTQLFRVHRSLA